MAPKVIMHLLIYNKYVESIKILMHYTAHWCVLLILILSNTFSSE